MRATIFAGSVAVAALLWTAGGSAPQKTPSSAEQDLMDAVNRERKERDLPILKWDEGLARAAHKHAGLMAEQGLMEHKFPDEPDLAVRAHDAGARFSHITENIGMADLASALHEKWMNSPGHRANILDPHIDSAGIAVVEGEGKVFAVQDFALGVEALSFEEQEKRVASLLNARGMRLVSIGDPERKNCASDKEPVGSRKAGFVSRYETSNISQLPPALEKELSLPRYKSAAVEACPQMGNTGFTSYRFIVVLY
jgi:uncharacterized protein YkwD